MTKHLTLLLCIGLAWGQNPCEDERYLELKTKTLDEMSEREYSYFLEYDSKCQDYQLLNESKDKEIIGKIEPPYILYINTAPKDAILYVDDKYIGFTPIEIEVDNNNPKIKITQNGMKPIERQLRLHRGKNKEWFQLRRDMTNKQYLKEACILTPLVILWVVFEYAKEQADSAPDF